MSSLPNIRDEAIPKCLASLCFSLLKLQMIGSKGKEVVLTLLTITLKLQHGWLQAKNCLVTNFHILYAAMKMY